MLSQLLFVRLKAAENALRDGRLDEAHRLATAPDLREHRRGAAVLAALTERFIERARTHFHADRFTEALMDLDRAEAGGVMKEQIAELRQHIQTVAAEARRRENSRWERIDAARKRIEGGSLVAGRKILEQASAGDHAARQLRSEVDNRREEVERVAKQAEQLIGQQQFAAAADRIRRAKTIDPDNERVAGVETRLCSRVLDNARGAIVQGRLSRAADELASLGKLGTALPARREMTELLTIARQAGANVRANQYADARRDVMSFQRLLPDAKWAAKVVEQLRQLDDIRTALFAGPLGDPIDDTVATTERAKRGGQYNRATGFNRRGGPGGSKEADTVALPNRARADTALPDRLLLLVDGGGSYLLLRGGRASLGRVASENPADIPVYSDVAERHANVERVDDDYFLFSARDVEVGGAKTKHQLLRDGDRIVLGRKAKLTFRLPSRKSPTAVLDLSDTTKMPNDVRRVVLFRQHATLGEGPHTHIRCRHAGPPLVLFERDGELWIRQKSDGHVDNEAQPLRLGESVEIGGASLVLEAWRLLPPGATRI